MSGATPISAARGKLIVISAPSGSGKTTIAREMLSRNSSLRFSVSATTRGMRRGEVDGEDYFFLTPEEFRRRVSRGEFVEWEEIYGDLYGTLQSEVDAALRGGKHLLFDVDVKGALSIKRAYPEACLIFIRPPSLQVLEQRLRSRLTEDAEALGRRLERVPMELDQAPLFDYQVVNDVLTKAIEEVHEIVQLHLRTP
ncbi:MAG: guanylate kinase [Bacteroidetes bacterium]|nr:guanylate kinase [Bacteroidota bacterium]